MRKKSLHNFHRSKQLDWRSFIVANNIDKNEHKMVHFFFRLSVSFFDFDYFFYSFSFNRWYLREPHAFSAMSYHELHFIFYGEKKKSFATTTDIQVMQFEFFFFFLNCFRHGIRLNHLRQRFSFLLEHENWISNELDFYLNCWLIWYFISCRACVCSFVGFWLPSILPSAKITVDLQCRSIHQRSRRINLVRVRAMTYVGTAGVAIHFIDLSEFRFIDHY